MLKIEDHHRSGSGTRVFVLKVAGEQGERGYKLCQCRSIEELHEALNHYYREGPRASQHASNSIEHCPLCRKGRGNDVQQPRPFLKLVRR